MLEAALILIPTAALCGTAGYAAVARVMWPVSAADRAAEAADAREYAALREHTQKIDAGDAPYFAGEARDEAFAYRVRIRTAPGGAA